MTPKTAFAFVVASMIGGSSLGQAPEMRFDVSVIKRIGGGGAPVPFAESPYFPGGEFRDPGVTLRVLIDMVYDVDDQGLKIVGLPDWAADAVYSVHAKAGPDYPAMISPNQNEANVKAMVRAMLADRFKLQMHREDRETEVWILQGKGDRAQLHPAAAPVAEGRTSVFAGDLRGNITGKNATMAQLARSLAMALHQRVVDQTGLTGFYDFDEKWGTPWQRGEPATANKLGPEGTAQLFSVLSQNLGLTLKSERIPADYWVVDHVERPGEN